MVAEEVCLIRVEDVDELIFNRKSPSYSSHVFFENAI